MTKNKHLESDYIFNSALETGIRAVCILSVNLSNKFDIHQLLAFDHLVVHTGDIINAPPSLHPANLQRNGELLVRRPLIEDGLALMVHKKLIKKEFTRNGFYYRATELACVFIESLTNRYIEEMSERAKWAIYMYQDSGDKLFSEVFNNAFERWTKEFHLVEKSIEQNWN
ncbi:MULTISPECIES: ABC-three component system middle component 2 [Vibrio]|uniref:Threonine efflux protein n=1 Tax=Vibrio crassostreae TaxID=246167 RepID=A0ABP1WR05_9VIBR|nr:MULTISPECIES: ABC-three component system middle component 2 [Vibrio]PTP15604.1 threonine transporter [Vibrio sp. 10N.286.51.C3]TCL30159.1 hypothetical protein EDB52_101443 [Vibrio crassostreae]TKE63333.1 threonine transporter [Vibrio sp. F12]CAK1865478.1 Threonine transporter [Vibrio crassostreae]CAK1873866.1 Threonine transporter [Vibrio crassostreae]